MALLDAMQANQRFQNDRLLENSVSAWHEWDLAVGYEIVGFWNLINSFQNRYNSKQAHREKSSGGTLSFYARRGNLPIINVSVAMRSFYARFFPIQGSG
jgi:hypothetical protein